LGGNQGYDRMKLLIKRTKRLEGKIRAPPSKSYTHRAVIVASMNGNSQISNVSNCDDARMTIRACEMLGATMRDGDTLNIDGFRGRPKAPSDEINLGESGASLRFALPLVCLTGGNVILIGDALRERPVSPLIRAIRDLGGGASFCPYTVSSITTWGMLRGGTTTVDGSISSQFISSLLMTCPSAKNDSIIKVRGELVSKPYVEMTLDVLEKAGITIGHSENLFFVQGQQKFKSLDYAIHGDYSSAAFLMAAACLVESDVTITDLVDDKQGDKKIIDILRSMGADIEKTGDAVHISGPFELEGIEVNCRETPDLVPVLAVLGAFAKGTTRIYDIAHLRYKESDRIYTLTNELRKLDVDVESKIDEIIVKNSKPRTGVTVNSHGDHRIAMALSLIGLKAGELTVEGREHISKSYPGFVDDMQHLGARMSRL